MGVATIATFALTGTALAGDVSTGGGSAVYAGDASAETLTVTQGSATTVTFDLAGAAVTTSDPACVASNSNAADADTEVTCTIAGLDVVSASMDAGNDVVTITAAVKVGVQGEAGDDRVDLTSATFDGGDAQANVFSCCSTNAATGGEGNDTLVAGPAGTILNGNDGNDSLTGGSGEDSLSGGLGQDALSAGAGDDLLDGGALVTFGPPFTATSDGADTFDGGPGADTATYAFRTVSVSVDLKVAAGQGEANENDSFANIENVDGGSGNDVLVGNDFSNTLFGADGTDRVEGGRGFDELRGGRDADVIGAAGDVEPDLIDCGRGFSTATTAAGTTRGADTDVARLDYLDFLATSSDCETVRRNAAPARAPQLGTGEGDRIMGDGNRDLLIGLLGNDTLIGLAASDELQGGFGNDRLFGGRGNDDLLGGHGNDIMRGNAGNDAMNGGPGRDVLLGNDGIDTLWGGEGVDHLDGGGGRDHLLARDGVRGDVVVCTRTRNVRQRDVAYVDRGDIVRNAAFCRVDRI